jgi:hypothetical protein
MPDLPQQGGDDARFQSGSLSRPGLGGHVSPISEWSDEVFDRSLQEAKISVFQNHLGIRNFTKHDWQRYFGTTTPRQLREMFTDGLDQEGSLEISIGDPEFELKPYFLGIPEMDQKMGTRSGLLQIQLSRSPVEGNQGFNFTWQIDWTKPAGRAEEITRECSSPEMLSRMNANFVRFCDDFGVSTIMRSVTPPCETDIDRGYLPRNADEDQRVMTQLSGQDQQRIRDGASLGQVLQEMPPQERAKISFIGWVDLGDEDAKRAFMEGGGAGTLQTRMNARPAFLQLRDDLEIPAPVLISELKPGCLGEYKSQELGQDGFIDQLKTYHIHLAEAVSLSEVDWYAAFKLSPEKFREIVLEGLNADLDKTEIIIIPPTIDSSDGGRPIVTFKVDGVHTNGKHFSIKTEHNCRRNDLFGILADFEETGRGYGVAIERNRLELAAHCGMDVHGMHSSLDLGSHVMASRPYHSLPEFYEWRWDNPNSLRNQIALRIRSGGEGLEPGFYRKLNLPDSIFELLNGIEVLLRDDDRTVVAKIADAGPRVLHTYRSYDDEWSLEQKEPPSFRNELTDKISSIPEGDIRDQLLELLKNDSTEALVSAIALIGRQIDEGSDPSRLLFRSLFGTRVVRLGAWIMRGTSWDGGIHLPQAVAA